MTSLSSPPLSDSKPDEYSRLFPVRVDDLLTDEGSRRFARRVDDIRSDEESDSGDKMANYDSNAGDGDGDSELKYNQQDLDLHMKNSNEKIKEQQIEKAADAMHHPVLLSMIDKLKEEKEELKQELKQEKEEKEELKQELKNDKLKIEKLEQEKSELNDKQTQLDIEYNEVHTRRGKRIEELEKINNDNYEIFKELGKTGGGSSIGDNNRKLEDGGSEEHGDQAMADTQTLLPQKKKRKVTANTQTLPPDAALAFGDGKDDKGREFKVKDDNSSHDHGMRYILKYFQKTSQKWDNGNQWFLHKKKGEWLFLGLKKSNKLKAAQQASGEWKVL